MEAHRSAKFKRFSRIVIIKLWLYRGKPGLAAKWLANTTGSSLMVEMDNMAPEQLTAALSSMKPATAAEMLQVCGCLVASTLPEQDDDIAVV